MHPQKGLVAQLNSAPDYGSGGSRFESWQGHLKHEVRSESCGLFYFPEKLSLLKALEGNKKVATPEGRCGLVFSGGNSLRNSEANPGRNLQIESIKFQDWNQIFQKHLKLLKAGLAAALKWNKQYLKNSNIQPQFPDYY